MFAIYFFVCLFICLYLFVYLFAVYLLFVVICIKNILVADCTDIMELLPAESLFSRQGKATTHMHPEFSFGPKRRPEPKAVEPVQMSELKQMLADLEKTRLTEARAEKSKAKPMTSSFRAISRDSYAYAFRNRTDSPKVGTYSPRFTVVEPRTTHTLKLSKPTTAPKQRILYLPSCMDPTVADFHKRDPTGTCCNKELKRNPLTLSEFHCKTGEMDQNYRGEVKKPAERLILPMDFSKQKPREDFVKATDPPHEKRLDFVDNNSLVNSSHRRVSSLPFEKTLSRKEFFEERDVNLSPYDANKEFTQRRVSTIVLDFGKMSPRRPLVLQHMVKTPMQLEDEKLQAAFGKQSNVRG